MHRAFHWQTKPMLRNTGSWSGGRALAVEAALPAEATRAKAMIDVHFISRTNLSSAGLDRNAYAALPLSFDRG
jgi:hypothetical protein